MYYYIISNKYNKYSKLSSYNITEECVMKALSYNTITSLYEIKLLCKL